MLMGDVSLTDLFRNRTVFKKDMGFSDLFSVLCLRALQVDHGWGRLCFVSHDTFLLLFL